MKLIVVSTNAGLAMGGEAMKALQYVQELLAQGRDVTLITHARCRAGLAGLLPAERVIYIEDSAAMRLCWRLRGLKRLVNPLFHLAVARLIRSFPASEVVVQYLCPISPVEPRFPPRGYTTVIGPVSGNIFYPEGFRHLDSPTERLHQRIYRPVQRLMGLMSRQYRQADRVLVSGYARTEEALTWAGCPREKMLHVWDAGLAEDLLSPPRMDPTTSPPAFVWIGRMVALKGVDLAIRALAQSTGQGQLTLYGDGPERGALEALAQDLGIADRVHFAGWLPHENLRAAMIGHRAFLFPALRESNGIIMQEAMAIGLPVVALRWGGPLGLASDAEALFVEPASPDQVVRDLAQAMDRLLAEPDLADRLSRAARQKAEAEFPWAEVARSWYAAAMAAKHTSPD
ncbi:glycosyltransferase family 4 protein [Arenibacterium sp. LLYu02]|uniref:glycosyltransferase family 4 protein n=1 Tax=Arenibacterium sp. LLYu02 TaxID=3404132 RepID=UPI003B219EB7